MSKAGEIAGGAARGFKADPSGWVKAIFFLLLAVLLLFVVIKVMKGISSFGNVLSDLGPTSAKETAEIIENPDYQANIKWLDDKAGLMAIGAAKKYKSGLDYLTKIGLNHESLINAGNAIFQAKGSVTTDQDAVYNALSTLPSKAAISLMAVYFNQTFPGVVLGGNKLLPFLSKNLKATEMKTVMEIIAKKPVL